MMGLPGSGKSTYVAEHATEGTAYINSLDEYWRTSGNKLDYAARCVAEHMASIQQHEAWIDGLILTQDDIKYLVEMYIKHHNKLLYVYLNSPVTVNIHIHQYEEDREACINNDIKRIMAEGREKSSQVSIENMTYEVLTDKDIEELSNLCAMSATNGVEYKLSYELLKVKKCGTWDIWYKQEGKNPNILLSESWSLGGTWANCWGNSGSISGEPAPEFTELDDILMATCPNISIMMYKKIYREYVTTEEYYEHDYYGGCETRAQWKADMKGIYDYLRENNLIEE